MAGLTSTFNIPLSTKAKIDATVLMDPEPNYVYALAGVLKSMPKGHGDSYRFPKYSRPNPFATPLTESEVDIDPQVLSKTFVDAQLNYYGTYFLITERTIDQNPEDVLRVHAGALNSALRETEDILTRNVLLSSTTSINCSGGENGDLPTDISQKDLSSIIATLTGNMAKPITSQVDGGNKFGTAPVAQAYMGIMHPDLIPDFEAMPDFKTLDQYGSSYKPLPAEWGAYSRIRFMQTTQVPKETARSASGNSIYTNSVLGRDAFSIIKQDQRVAEIVGPNKVGSLRDKYEYGIKTVFSAALLFDEHVANVLCTRSSEVE